MSSILKKILLLSFIISVSSHSQAMRPKRDINDISPGLSNEECLVPKAKRAKVETSKQSPQSDRIPSPDVLKTILGFVHPENLSGVARSHAYVHNMASAPVLRAYDFFFDDREKDVKNLDCKLHVTGMDPQKYKLLVAWISLDPQHILYGSPKPIRAEPHLFGAHNFSAFPRSRYITYDILQEPQGDKVARYIARIITIRMCESFEPGIENELIEDSEIPLLPKSALKLMLMKARWYPRRNGYGHIEHTFEDLHYLLGTLFPQLSDPKEIHQLDSRLHSSLSLELSMELSDLLCRYLILREDYTGKETTMNNETPAVKKNAQIQNVLRNIFKNPLPFVAALHKQIRPCLDDPHLHPSIKSKASILIAKLKAMVKWIDPRETVLKKLSYLNFIIELEKCSGGFLGDRLDRARAYIEKGFSILSQYPPLRSNSVLTRWREMRKDTIKAGKVYGRLEDLTDIVSAYYLQLMPHTIKSCAFNNFGLDCLELLLSYSDLDHLNDRQTARNGRGHITALLKLFAARNTYVVPHSLDTIIKNSPDARLRKRAHLLLLDWSSGDPYQLTVSSPQSNYWSHSVGGDQDYIEQRGIRLLISGWSRYNRLLTFACDQLIKGESAAVPHLYSAHQSTTLLTCDFLQYLSDNPKSPLNCTKRYATEMLTRIHDSYAEFSVLKVHFDKKPMKGLEEKLKRPSRLNKKEKQLAMMRSIGCGGGSVIKAIDIRTFFSQLYLQKRGLMYQEQPTLVRPLD